MSLMRHLFIDDEPLTVEIARTNLCEGSKFIPAESRYRGYQVQVKKTKVVIVRKNAWRLFLGLPPLYHFVGTISDADHNNTMLIPGTITMRLFFRFILSLWVAGIVLGVGIFCIRAMLLAGAFMYSPESVDIADLAGAGFMIGGGLIVLLFGLLIIKFITSLDRRERQRLIQFCTSLK